MKPDKNHAVVTMQDGHLVLKCLRCSVVVIPPTPEIVALAKFGKAFGDLHEKCAGLQ